MGSFAGNAAFVSHNGLSGPISTGGPTEFDVIKTGELEKVSVIATKMYSFSHFSFTCTLKFVLSVAEKMEQREVHQSF